MKRVFLAASLAAAMVGLLVPTPVLARPAPSANLFSYAGVFGDIVRGGDNTDTTSTSYWANPDGVKDSVFELELASNATQDVASLQISVSGGYWDTLPPPGNGWAIGVTSKAHGKTLLNATNTSYTADLSNGLRIYLHVQGGGYLSGGTDVTLTVTYNTGSPLYLHLYTTVG